MKKLIILFIGLILIPINVFAETFYAGKEVKEVPLYLDKISKQSYRYFKTAYKTSDNNLVYCVEPSKLLNVNANYNLVTSNQAAILNISNEQWNRIESLVHFGYGYNNHLEEKWAAITQYLIWQTVLPDGWFLTFTDGYGGEYKNIHEKEVNEIESLIKEFNQLPSFENKSFSLTKNEVLILNDKNNVFKNYQLVNNSSLDVKKDNNNLEVRANENGQFELLFKRGNYIPTNLYVSDQDQAVVSINNGLEKTFKISINVSSGNLKINRKLDNYLDNDSSVENATYEIIDSHLNKHILSTDKFGEILLEDIPTGKTIIKEINPSEGYISDEKIYEIDITNNFTSVLDIEPELIKKNINIIKKYLIEETNFLPNEVNSCFSITKNDTIKLMDKTNEFGTVSFLVPYGKYEIVQNSGIINYLLMDNYLLNVTDNIEENLTFINYKKEEIVEKDNHPDDNIPIDKEIPVEDPPTEEKIDRIPDIEEIENLNGQEELIIHESQNEAIIEESNNNNYILDKVENPKTGSSLINNLLILIKIEVILVIILKKMQ